MKSSSVRLMVFLLGWLAAASVLIATDALKWVPLPPALNVPLLALALATGFTVAVIRVRWLRAALADVGVRRIVAVHGLRVVGAVFLWLHAQGRVPAEFAFRAGWGDIATAVGALLLLFIPDGPGFRRALWWWNLFGAADLVVAVGTAAWFNVTQPGSMGVMAGLPYCLIPLWGVPAYLGSHVWLFRWLATQGKQEKPAPLPA